ncbi:hypothetical protein QEN19_002822 [Hanseniaspora menglaensis]
MFKATGQLNSGLANRTRNILSQGQKYKQRKRMQEVDATIYNIREGLKKKMEMEPTNELKEAYWNDVVKDNKMKHLFDPMVFKPEHQCTPLAKYFYVNKKSKHGFKSVNWVRFKTKTSINRETPYALTPNRIKKE